MGNRQWAAPAFGEGHELYLPGRGTTYYRIIEGPPGAPVFVVVHGLTATTQVNFGQCGSAFDGMTAVGFDMRGHGRGIKGPYETYSRSRPYLETCADDIAAGLDALGIDKAIIVGYSMGTAIAPLLWKRHPEKVAGLVLCGGAARFTFHVPNWMMSLSMANADNLARLMPWFLRRSLLPCADFGTYNGKPMLDEFGHHDPRIVIEAARALAGYDAREWIGDINVPTAVVMIENDQLVPPKSQLQLSQAIPGATLYRVRSPVGHLAAGLPGPFPRQLRAACLDVASRTTEVPARALAGS